MNNDYVMIEVRVLRVHERSVIVEDDSGDEHVIGRSCIFGPDDREFDTMRTPKDNVQFSVFRWLADKEGLPVL